jgi:hypothetical protein
MAHCQTPTLTLWHQDNVPSDGVNPKGFARFKKQALANHAWQ